MPVFTRVAERGSQTLSGSEVKQAEILIWAAGGHVEARRVHLNL